MRAADMVIGARFGRWIILRRDRDDLLCRCDCGTVRNVYLHSVRKGVSRSCGCLQRELAAQFMAKHGHAKSREYRAWQQARLRCESPASPEYHNYGGRGITMCAEWRHDFAAFFAEIGPRPSPTHSLDRIDNERGYEPGNVRWATKSEQNSNRRRIERPKGNSAGARA